MMNTLGMTRTIGLADDAYEALAGLKRPNESFSDLVRRLIVDRRRKPSIMDSAGTWPMSPEEADRLMADLYAARERSDHGRPIP